MDKVVVDYNATKHRFEITTPYIYNGVAQALPSRKWNKPARKWFAPVVRKNVEHIMRCLVPMSNVYVTAEAHKAMMECAQRVNNRAYKAMPDWYEPVMPMRSYQQAACNKFYSADVGALFMVPGAGKSKTTIDLCAARAQSAGELNIDAIMLFCPFSIRSNWLKELEKHCPIDYDAEILDYKTKRGRERYERLLTSNKLRILIVGIESMSTGQAFVYAMRFAQATKAACVVDEASKIKKHNANRTKRITSVGRDCAMRLILTGTPITQGIIDLFAQMDFLSPDIIGAGDFYSFRNMYAVMGGFNGKEIVGYKNVDDLMESIKPYTFQVTQEEALPELPERTYTQRYVTMSPTQAKAYKQIVETGIVTNDHNHEKMVRNALDKLLRLQQITGGFIPYDKEDPITGQLETALEHVSDAKVAEVISIAEESSCGIIIWCRFRAEIQIVADALRKAFGIASTVEFHGGLDKDARWQSVQRFEAGDARFFVATQSSAGMGIDLLKGHIAVYYSNDFSYENRVQSEARNHRLGQHHPVLYIDLVCEGTIDERVIEVIKNKGSMANYVRESLRDGRNPLEELA